VKSDGGIFTHPLPSDASVSIDAVALTWLAKYDIETSEAIDHNMMWSAKFKQLLFPCYLNPEKQEGLQAWQARNFSPDATCRYFNSGRFHSFLHILNLYDGRGDDVIVVEDLVSAIKISRRYSALCLFGTNLNNTQMTDLRHLTENVTFWLDEDKASKGLSLAKAVSQFDIAAKLIVTKHDPKEYNNAQIQDIIGV
jgi:hypothetical protein